MVCISYRLDIIVQLSVGYNHSLLIIVPHSALWHKFWNIKQFFPHQVVFADDEGRDTLSNTNKIDLRYLYHFSYLFVVKAYGRYIRTDLKLMQNLIMTGNERIGFPTGITAIIGYSHILRFIINSQPYHSILLASGITGFQRNVSSHLKVYYCYGEFLRDIMQITDLTKEVMRIRYPIVFEQAYDAIQLRMGGRLSDVPMPNHYLTMESLNVAVRCAKEYSKSSNIYVASDSIIAKKFMKNSLYNKNVTFVNEKSLFSDSQLNNMESVYIATYSAVADIYILGNSQQCIMTDESTFAYSGCAISGRPPVIIPLKKEVCLTGDDLREL